MSIVQLWRKTRRLPARKRLLVLEAMFWLCVARLLIVAVPFPRIGQRLGKLRPPAPGSPEFTDRSVTAREVAWAIDRAARLIPFELVCLPRALAAWKLLENREVASRLHFGALQNYDGKPLATHAWLDAEGVEVTGYPVAHHFVELGYYSRNG